MLLPGFEKATLWVKSQYHRHCQISHTFQLCLFSVWRQVKSIVSNVLRGWYIPKNRWCNNVTHVKHSKLLSVTCNVLNSRMFFNGYWPSQQTYPWPYCNLNKAKYLNHTNKIVSISHRYIIWLSCTSNISVVY